MISKVRIGGDFEVWRQGTLLGPPPSAAAACLFLGLLDAAPHWSDRQDLSQRMELSDGAFRVALHRLRQWLGEDSTVGRHGQIRLTDEWVIDTRLSSGEPALGAMIAPGLKNPLAEELRRKWSPQAEPKGVEAGIAFAESVMLAAQLDADAARGILTAGGRLADLLPIPETAQLLAVVRPKNREAPYFAEYCALQGALMLRQGASVEAVSAFRCGFRQAQRTRSKSTASHLSKLAAYALVEAGEFRRAEYWVDWLDVLRRPTEFVVDAANIKAALAWNANDHASAVRLLEAVRSDLPRASHSERMSYYGNFAVLQSELGEQNKADDLLAEGTICASRELDWVFWFLRELMASTQMARSGLPEEAAYQLGKLAVRMRSVDMISSMYALEWQVEALAAAKRNAEAINSSRRLGLKRRELGLKVNPRTKAKLERCLAAA